MTPITSAAYGRIFRALGNGTMDANPSWALNSCWTKSKDPAIDRGANQMTEWIHASLPILLIKETRFGKHLYFATFFQSNKGHPTSFLCAATNPTKAVP